MWVLIVIGILVLGLVFLARYVREVKRGYRDAEGTKRPWWIVGNGRHGGV